MNVGIRIYERRKSLKMSQGDLADRAKIVQGQISRYELGKNEPTAEVIKNIATALETTSDYLLGLTDYPDRPLQSEDDLNSFERELIEIARHMDEESRTKLLGIAKVL